MSKCGKPVTHVSMWANKKHYACEEHTKQLAHLGAAIGVSTFSQPVIVIAECQNEVKDEEDSP